MKWIVKALIQGAIARAPYGERINYALQRAAGAHNDDYVDDRIGKGLQHLASIAGRMRVPDATIVEIGTGWDAMHTIMLAALGARRIITVDHVNHLRFERARYVAQRLQAHAETLANLYGLSQDQVLSRLQAAAQATTLEGFLSTLNIEFHAPADTAFLPQVPDATADIVYSHLVLSYVPETDLQQMSRTFARVLKSGGLSVHRVRLADPFEAAKGDDRLDFLRYSDRAWTWLCSNSVQYNNRLRACQLIQLFERAGGESEFVEKRIEPGDVEKARSLQVAPRFKGLPAEELAVTGLTVVSRFDGTLGASAAPVDRRESQPRLLVPGHQQRAA